MKEENIVANKSLDFAVRIVNLNKHLRETQSEYTMSKQLLKCGTSVGANVREAVNAQSRADFISKMHIAYKEIGETEFWLELLFRTKYIDQKAFDSIISWLAYLQAYLKQPKMVKMVKLNVRSTPSLLIVHY